MSGGSHFVPLIALFVLYLLHIHGALGYRYAFRVSFSQVPIRATRLYGKHRHPDKLKHARREKNFLNRRQEQDAIKEPATLHRIASTQRAMMENIFGQPMSQRLGDGGVLPHLNHSTDKVAYVKEYFGIADDMSEEVQECCKRVAKSPNTTCGEFSGKEPLISLSFYKEPVTDEYDEDFNRVADHKEGMPPLAPELDEQEREGRYYHGLFTDIAFQHLPEKDMEELRKMEMDAKQGIFRATGASKQQSSKLGETKAHVSDAMSGTFPLLGEPSQ